MAHLRVTSLSCFPLLFFQGKILLVFQRDPKQRFLSTSIGRSLINDDVDDDEDDDDVDDEPERTRAR